MDFRFLTKKFWTDEKISILIGFPIYTASDEEIQVLYQKFLDMGYKGSKKTFIERIKRYNPQRVMKDKRKGNLRNVKFKSSGKSGIVLNRT